MKRTPVKSSRRKLAQSGILIPLFRYGMIDLLC